MGLTISPHSHIQVTNIPEYPPPPWGNPLKVIFRSLPISEIPGDLEKANPVLRILLMRAMQPIAASIRSPQLHLSNTRGNVSHYYREMGCLPFNRQKTEIPVGKTNGSRHSVWSLVGVTHFFILYSEFGYVLILVLVL